MKRKFRIILLINLTLLAIFSLGCTEEMFKPAVVLEMPGVSTFELYATATDTASLPTTDVTVKSLSKISCNLESYTVSYKTQYGQPLPNLAVASIPIEQKLDAEGEIAVTVKPYTRRVVDLFELSSSDISPLSAEITLTFKDYNGNWVSKNAHCLLYSPE